MKFRPLFHPRCSVFWATTYTFDIETFESHLLPRLGGAPLNAVVLADQNHLEAEWAQLAAVGELFQLGRAGRQYLLRGIEWPHRFHPKTYFFGRPDSGTLVVGSGNCGLNGFLNGNEVATRFDSKDPAGMSAIRHWAAWMTRVVHETDDSLCEEQWRNVQRSLGWLAGPLGQSTFVHNLDESLSDQLRRRVGDRLDELHLLAPFCDPGAKAIASLASTFHPKRLCLYAPDRMAVDGPKLVRALRASGARIEVRRPDPQAYVHAKLIGAMRGKQGWLLSGSANLSQSALLSTGQHANCEAAVLVEAAPATIRELFNKPELAWKTSSVDELASLTHDLPPEPTAPQLRLLRASIDEHGVVTAFFRSIAHVGEARLRLWAPETEKDVAAAVVVPAGGSGILIASAETVSEELENVCAVCIIVDKQKSGYVPLEEPASLRALLEAVGRERQDPDGLTLDDLSSPLGQLVVRIRERVDFSAVLEDIEVTKTIAAGAAGMDDANGDEGIVIEDLNELLLRRRRHLVRPRSTLPTIDEILAEIQALRDEAPAPAHRLHVVVGKHEEGGAENDGQTKHKWSPTKRLQVRFSNALDRMCRAAGDLRIFDRDPEQAGRNIETLIDVLHACHFREEVNGFVSLPRMPVLTEHLLLSLGGSEGSPGLAQKLTEADLADLLKSTALESRQRFAELITHVIAPGGHEGKERLYRLQPAMQRLVDPGIIAPADDDVRERLTHLLHLNDDEHWTATMWRKHRVSVRIHPTASGKWLLISGSTSVLDDPASVQLVSEWLWYVGGDNWDGAQVRLAIFDGHAHEGIGATRIAITVGDTAWLQAPGRVDSQSSEKVTRRVIEALVAQHQPWAALFVAGSADARQRPAAAR